MNELKNFRLNKTAIKEQVRSAYSKLSDTLERRLTVLGIEQNNKTSNAFTAMWFKVCTFSKKDEYLLALIHREIYSLKNYSDDEILILFGRDIDTNNIAA